MIVDIPLEYACATESKQVMKYFDIRICYFTHYMKQNSYIHIYVCS